MLDSLLAHEGAQVSAIGDNGLFVPMPPGLPPHRCTLVSGASSGLDLVEPSDLTTVIEAWERARANGVATVRVHPVGRPDTEVTMHLVDARHRVGVYLGIIVGDRTDEPVVPAHDDTPRPRVAFVRKNQLAVFTAVDGALTRILGWTADELIGTRSLELVHPEDRQRAVANWMDMLGTSGASHRVRLRHRHRDGSWVWFEVTNTNRLEDPEGPHVVTEMVDVSAETSAQEAFRASELLLHRLAETFPSGVLQLQAGGRVGYRNARLGEILGYEIESVEDLLAAVTEPDRLRAVLTGATSTGRDADLEVDVTPVDRTPRRVLIAVRPLVARTDQPTATRTPPEILLCISDITQASQLRAELTRRATHDDLTGCLSRAAVLDVLRDPQDPEESLTLLYIDLDGFKEINDTYGHDAGDHLLRTVAERLGTACRGGDVVGRLGGDEFLVVLRGISDTESAMTTARRIVDQVRLPVELEDRVVLPSLSIGVVWQPSAVDQSSEHLIALADNAMYRSKNENRCRPSLADAAIRPGDPS